MAPEAGAGLRGAGPGHPGRGRLLVRIGDGRKLPLGLLPLDLGLVNELDDPVATVTDYARELQCVVVSIMMILNHLQNVLGDIPQLSLATAHTAHFCAILITLCHGHVTAGPGPRG